MRSSRNNYEHQGRVGFNTFIFENSQQIYFFIGVIENLLFSFRSEIIGNVFNDINVCLDNISNDILLTKQYVSDLNNGLFDLNKNIIYNNSK
jgi:hypothetical protein